MKLNHLQAVFLILILLFLIQSCTSYKGVSYFQDLNKDSILKEKITNFSPLTIQPGDLLAIHVNSLSHDADAIFNYNLDRPNGLSIPTVQTGNNTESANVGIPSESTVFGYLVDLGGYIHLPMIDSVKVAGLTTAQISTILEAKLSGYLSKPVVNIRIQNFKISVLGDVNKPGNFTVSDEKITISEALSLAGDLNTTGIRTNVLLIREIDGNREFVPINLTSKSIFNSPYYYLKNNDIIYVQPNRERVSSSDSAYQKASLIIAALSILAIFITRVK